jgi:hypothetical protein
MKLKSLLLVVAFASSFAFAQTTPGISNSDISIDPTADTDNPTLLKAQIMILQNAREATRAKLAQLSDFQEFEKFDSLAEAKQAKLNGVIQGLQRDQVQADKMKADKGRQDAANLQAEQAALLKANQAKAASATKPTAK